jgi:hypothetical protein
VPLGWVCAFWGQVSTSLEPASRTTFHRIGGTGIRPEWWRSGGRFGDRFAHEGDGNVDVVVRRRPIADRYAGAWRLVLEGLRAPALR